jgi:diguanylate cyclase (GGDEF)-like protein/PAS domain S-box-containing protein
MLDERELKLLDEFLARSPIAVVAWDDQNRISYWSRRAQLMFGYTAAQVVGKRVEEFDFVPKEDMVSVREQSRLLDELPARGATINVNRNYRADGELRTCRWTTFAVQTHERYRVLSYVEDISESVTAQSALVESEERFRSLFEYNPDIIMIFSSDGKIVDANQAIRRISGVGPDKIIGMHYSAFLHRDDVAIHEAYLKRAMTGETLTYNARALTLNGRQLDVAVTTVPVYRDGKIEGAFSIIRDETEQRAASAQIEQQERALADSEARLRSLFKYNPDGVVAVNRDGIVVEANEATFRIGNFPPEQVIGAPFDAFLPEHEKERGHAAFQKAIGGEAASLVLDSFRIDGSKVELSAVLIPQFAAGEIVGAYVMIQDITERRAAEREAGMQATRMRNLYFIAASGDYPDVRMHASLELGCQAFNLDAGAVVEIADGVPRIESYFQDADKPEVDSEAILRMAAAVADVRGSPTPVSYPNGIASRLDIGGATYGALVFASAEPTEHEIGGTDADMLGLIAALIAGSIDRGQQRARLRTMAYYDALTGLPNRVFLAEKLRDAIEVAQSRLGRVAVLFLDLDRFKDVNDTLGHQRGDLLLQLAAERLQSILGEDATIARMGGDEFVVLLTDAQDHDWVRDTAERVIVAITEPFELDEYEQFISTSIGIAMYPEDGGDDQTLIKNADIAMYRAKDRGRNAYYFYNSSLEAPIHMRLSQEKMLRRALECEEFLVYYQPQLNIRTGQIVSLEALVRWNHPKSGLIEPSHFIPSAEISGLIVPLGDYVLERACKQVKEWHDTLGPLRIAVNLSARQFHSRDLRRRIMDTLSRTNLDPSFLEAEITESVAMSDAAQTVSIVRDLKAAGIRTAVDDFGTGYSSLAYLRRFALDTLKIDGSFVVGLGHEAFDETIVRTVIGMAQSLGLEVVAEGVETSTQMDFLKENGCDLVQGYAVSPPLPAKEFETFFRGFHQLVPAQPRTLR